jgi:hypothetical protein
MPRRSHNQAHENQTWKLRRILRGHPIVRRAADELLPLVYGELTSNRFPLSLSDPFSIPLN